MPVDLDQSSIDPTLHEYHRMLQELQGNILQPHGRGYSALLFLKFKGNQVSGRKWVSTIAESSITSFGKQLHDASRIKNNGGQDLFASFLLSAEGYRALGFSSHKIPKDLTGSFRAGIKDAETLQRLSDPPLSTWEEAYQHDIHALMLLAHDSPEKLEKELRNIQHSVDGIADVLTTERSVRLTNRKGQFIEHFGYVDQISQPLFLKTDIDREREKHSLDHWDPRAPLKLVLARDPNGEDGDCFGSYLVYRKLRQDVAGFRKRTRDLAKELGIGTDLAGALVMGRFQDGTPVAVHPGDGLGGLNNFNYSGDPEGRKCPLHAHIRKVNSRGDTGRFDPVEGEQSERSSRIARRSLAYGLPERGEAVGMLFLCFQSDIGLQFEFIQRAWVNQNHFITQQTGLDPIIAQDTDMHQKTGLDPSIGQEKSHNNGQRWPRKWGEAGNVRFDFASFVTMKGGEYFFAPCISFLKRITCA